MVETQFLNITDLSIRTTVNWFNNASLVVTNISLMLINKKIVIFQLKQKAKEINMSTQKKNSLNGQKCQFLHKKQKNKIPNQWHMTIIMHVVQIKTYFYLHLLEAKKKNQQQPKKKPPPRPSHTTFPPILTPSLTIICNYFFILD